MVFMAREIVELCLVFGCASAAGIFDRAAKVVLSLVLLASGFPGEMTVQHLDDVCAADQAGSKRLLVFDDSYKKIAHIIGVKLAPRDDPEKSFGPTTSLPAKKCP